MSMQTLTSRCMCGAVELELAGSPAAMAYCHCESCRGWIGAPMFAASLWPAANVRVVRGEDRLGVFRRTPGVHRKFCRECGTPVLIEVPALGMIDVPAGNVPGLDYRPTAHVHYSEKVLAVADGLPKFRDYPLDYGGSGERLPE